VEELKTDRKSLEKRRHNLRKKKLKGGHGRHPAPLSYVVPAATAAHPGSALRSFHGPFSGTESCRDSDAAGVD
jgi:hypothetical protein